LYRLVNKVVKRRRRSVRREDGLQYLLDQGESSFAIVEFILGTLFAGLINSGINAAAMLSHLACAPEWAWEVREEARHVVNKYAKGGTRPMSEKLKDVPFEAFDSDFPVTYMCFRETIRLHGHMVQFRRNVGNYAIPLGASEVIPSGAFAAYHTGDVHMNPQVYPNPELWDPARHSPDKVQDKSTPQPFVGWGQGRHPCSKY
jgi:cytochrome P450